MKKVLFALLLTVLLTGLSGCRTTRATMKTGTKQEVMQTQVTDTSRTEQAATTEQTTAALSGSERQNVAIEFEEWEYYPIAASDTTTGGNSIRASENAGKPPNTGSVKKRRKGTITINADRQTEISSNRQTTTTAEIQAAGKTKTDTKAKVNEKAESTEDTSGGKWYVLLIVGILLAAVYVWAGIGITRCANR